MMVMIIIILIMIIIRVLLIIVVVVIISLLLIYFKLFSFSCKCDVPSDKFNKEKIYEKKMRVNFQEYKEETDTRLSLTGTHLAVLLILLIRVDVLALHEPATRVTKIFCK